MAKHLKNTTWKYLVRDFHNGCGSYEVHVYHVDDGKDYIYDISAPVTDFQHKGCRSSGYKNPQDAMKEGIRQLRRALVLKEG